MDVLLNKRKRKSASVKRRMRVGARKKHVRRSRSVKRRAAVKVSRWHQWGRQAGREDAGLYTADRELDRRKALNDLWVRRLAAPEAQSWNWSQYTAAMKGYLEGCLSAAGSPVHDWLLLPTSRTVAAIISVMNEEHTIAPLLRQLNRMPLQETLVVVNGSTDGSLHVIRQHSHATIIHYPEPLGYDVGRSIGARVSSADILLFLDGDIPVTAEKLIPFIGAIGKGTDVALNDISPFLPVFSKWDSVTVMKRFLNEALGRPELGAGSLTAVPHAWARQAIEQIGFENLAVPPKAQAQAIAEQLRIEMPGSINVIAPNKRKVSNHGNRSPVARMIIGDHIEALHSVMELQGKRIVFPDHIRQRQYAGGRL